MARMPRTLGVLIVLLVLLVASGAPTSLRAEGAGSPAESGHEVLTGRFHTLFEDDFVLPERSRQRFVLIDDQGGWTELSVPEPVLRGAGGSAALRGRRVRVVVEAPPGRAIGITGGPGAPLAVLSLAAAGRPGGGSGGPLTKVGGNIEAETVVLGAQPYASLACKFKGLNQTPRDIPYIDGLMGSDFPGLDHYWREISAGLIELTGSTASGWYRLPEPLETYYDTVLDVADYGLLLADCVAEADPDLYLPDFAGINVMVNHSLGGRAVGGSATLNVDGVVKTYGVTWLPDWAWQRQDITAHEMGHSFGWPHSSGPYGQVYDSHWDVMSSGSAGVTDPDYGPVGSGTIAYHLDLAGWIDPLRKLVVPPDSSSTVILERLDQPVDSGAYLMLEIAADADTTYTVEARKQVGYDSGIPAEGVVIHDVSYQAFVVDEDGDGDPNDEGAVWVPGETFSDGANGVSVTVDSDTGSGYQVTVVRGSQTPLPNLTVTELSGAAISAPGGKLRVSGEAVNLGSAGTGSSYWIGIYLSEDGVITDDDWILSNLGRSALGAGLTTSWGSLFTVPAYLSTGTYTLGALADSDDRINETDETDNSRLGNTVVVDYFAPAVTTDPVSTTSSTQATLNGTVNSLGQEGTAWFEWGPSTAYGNITATTQLSTVADDLPFSETVSGLEPGATYHVRALAQNATGTSYGTDRTFVASAADVDLVATAISGPAEAALGASVQLGATVLNQGTVPAEEFRTSIFLSEEPQIGATSRSCARNAIFGGLLGGESRSEGFNCRIPLDLAPGTYYWVAVADDDDRVAEVDEGNNSLSGGTVLVTQADLAISAVSGPSAAGANDTIDVSTTVENLGTGDAVAFRVGIYLSTDSVIDTGDILVGDRLLPSLGVGLTDAGVTAVTIPANTPSGSYFLGAVADHQSALPESNEANNALAGNQVTVTNSLPDLVVTTINAPTSVNTGSLLSGQITVRNQGASSTVIGGTIAMYLSEDTVIDASDMLLGTLAFPELWTGQYQTLSYKFGITIDTPRGRYWVGAVVDSTGVVVESDETNNTGTAPDSIRVK